MTIHLDQLCSELQRNSPLLYLNTGGQGVMPLSSHAAMVESAKQLELLGPGSKAGYEYAAKIEQDLQQTLATLLNATTNELTLATSTSEGIALTARALSLEHGDEVIVSDEEHPAGLRPWLRLAQEIGVRIVYVSITPLDSFVSRLSAKITANTRVISLSHVSYLTGTVLPIAEVCKAIQRQDIITVIDGAQSVGVLPISAGELGCDVLAFPGQKWLLGPIGSGGLFVSKSAVGKLRSYRVSAHTPDGNITYPTGASKITHSRVGTLIGAPLLNSVSLLSAIGVNNTHSAIMSLTRSVFASLSSIPGVSLSTPRPEGNDVSGLLTFRFDKVSAEEAQLRLLDQHEIVVRTVELNDGPALRASFHCFQTDKDITRLAEACETVAKGTG